MLASYLRVSPRRTPISWWTALLLPLAVFAGPTNRTIDDQWGDSVTSVLPAYSVNWNFGPNCTICATAPSQSKAFGSTWHDTTSSNPSTAGHYVTLSFTGTAIWVYVIVVNNATSSSTITYTNTTFQLDGVAVGTYTHVPDSSASKYEYNVTAFSKTGLSNEHHTLVMTAVQGSKPSLLIFDWAMYTYDDETTSASTVSATSTSSSGPTDSGAAAQLDSTHHQFQTGAIAGGVVGGVAFIAICFGILLFFLRRRAASKGSGAHDREIVPFVAPSSSRHRGSSDGEPTSPFASWRPDTAVAYNTRAPPSGGQSTKNSKHAWAVPSSKHDQLSREVGELRQQIASMRTSRSLVGNATAPNDVHPASSGAEDSELRQEMETLRAELAWLRAETGGAGRGEPPPAYA